MLVMLDYTSWLLLVCHNISLLVESWGRPKAALEESLEKYNMGKEGRESSAWWKWNSSRKCTHKIFRSWENRQIILRRRGSAYVRMCATNNNFLDSRAANNVNSNLKYCAEIFSTTANWMSNLSYTLIHQEKRSPEWHTGNRTSLH